MPIKVPRNIWILGFTSLLNDTSSEMIHAVLPLFLVSGLGASVALVGLIEGIAEASVVSQKIRGTLHMVEKFQVLRSFTPLIAWLEFFATQPYFRC